MPTEKRQRKKEGHQARKAAALAQARRQARKRRLLTLGAVVVAFLLVMFVISVVSDDDGTDVTAADGSSSTSTPTTEAAEATTPTSAPPEPPAPGGDEPVTELGIEDLEVGDGETVEAGDTIVAHYYGATYADGEKFQSSWDSGSTFETVIGQGAVIPGWDEGIPGMKVGGRRKLVIPAEMAYGTEDKGDGSPVGDLVFIVDVYDVK